jgi:hypothetical protein
VRADVDPGRLAPALCFAEPADVPTASTAAAATITNTIAASAILLLVNVLLSSCETRVAPGVGATISDPAAGG